MRIELHVALTYLSIQVRTFLSLTRDECGSGLGITPTLRFAALVVVITIASQVDRQWLVIGTLYVYMCLRAC